MKFFNTVFSIGMVTAFMVLPLKEANADENEVPAAPATDIATQPANGATPTEATVAPAPVAVGEGAYYPNGCIPMVSLPVYPESQSCVASYSVYYPQPVDEAQGSAEQTTTPPQTTVTNNLPPQNLQPTNTTTAQPTTTVSSSTTSYVYYYPSTYYSPPPASYLAVFATGVAVGAVYSNNYYYHPYYPYYPYNPYHPYGPYNPYYPYQSHSSWHGDNGNAGYSRGPQGGAYHWNANGYSGGGYCYHGNCGHTNNWDGGNKNNVDQTNLTTTTHKQNTNNTLSSTQGPNKKINNKKENQNLTQKNNALKQRPAHRNMKQPTAPRPAFKREGGLMHEMGGHGFHRK